MIHRLLVTRGNQGCHESCGPVIGFSSKDVAGFIALKMEGSPQKERNSQKVPFGIKRCTFWNQVNLCRRHKCLHPPEQVRESRTTVSDRKGRDGPCWSRARAQGERLHGSRGGPQSGLSILPPKTPVRGTSFDLVGNCTAACGHMQW